MQDVRVRLAIAHAIDRDAVLADTSGIDRRRRTAAG